MDSVVGGPRARQKQVGRSRDANAEADAGSDFIIEIMLPRISRCLYLTSFFNFSVRALVCH